MRIQRWQQRWPLLDNPFARMLMAMDLAFVRFRMSEPTFQCQIVTRQISNLFAEEQPRLKALHQLGHLGKNNVVGVLLKRLLKLLELSLSIRSITRVRRQQLDDTTDMGCVKPNSFERLSLIGNAFLNATTQTHQQAVDATAMKRFLQTIQDTSRSSRHYIRGLRDTC